jgi:hypothetical protein
VDGRPAPPDGGVVETWQVVMRQGRAMQELDRCGERLGEGWIAVAAGKRDRQAELRPDPRAARKDGVAHGGRQPWRRGGRFSPG